MTMAHLKDVTEVMTSCQVPVLKLTVLFEDSYISYLTSCVVLFFLLTYMCVCIMMSVHLVFL